MLNKTTTIFIVTVLAISGITAVFLINNNESEGDTPIVIIDDSGTEFKFDDTISKIAVSNSTAAAMIQILGQTDKIVAIDDETKNIAGENYANVVSFGSYKAPSGDIILKSGALVLICKSGSRTLTNETELTNMGIKVLRLDCFGESKLNDMEQLVKLLGGNSKERANDYLTFYNPIINEIENINNDNTNDKNFLFMFTSMKKPYSISSELGKITESIAGKNALREMSDNSTSSTSKISEETIYNYDKENGIDKIILRSASRDSGVTNAYGTYIGISSFYSDLKAVGTGEVYIIDTEILSGPLDFIGYVCIAKAMGLETELNPDTLLKEFNELFGFEIPPRDYLYQAYALDNIVPIV